MLRVLALVAMLATTAVAEPELSLEIQEKAVVAKVRGLTKREPVELRELHAESRKPISATSVRGFAESGPVAIAFVINGAEYYLGGTGPSGDELVQDDELLKPLAVAFDRLELGTALPPGSEALLVSYSTGAEIKKPWKPASELAGADLGSAKDYKGKLGADLVAGVGLALGELKTRAAKHKLLIVIGDGNATNDEAARSQLQALATEAADVTFAALVVKSPLSPETALIDVINNLTPWVTTSSLVGVEAALEHTVQSMTEQFEATFELAHFVPDGKSHGYSLVHHDEELDSAMLTVPLAPPKPAPSNAWRWLVLAGVVAAFSLVSLLVFRKRD